MWKVNLIIITFVLLGVSSFTNAQTTIKGRVIDADDKKPIPSVLVKILVTDSLSSRILAYTLTDKNGQFNISFKSAQDKISLEFSLLSYKTASIKIKNKSQIINQELTSSPIHLKEVSIKAPAITNRGDTINYSVSSFTSPKDRKIEDIIKKLPGITVKRSGQIEYQGKPINRFYIEGLDMLGGKYNLATQNIPVEEVVTV